jgi:hypothetical protein
MCGFGVLTCGLDGLDQSEELVMEAVIVRALTREEVVVGDDLLPLVVTARKDSVDLVEEDVYLVR